MSILRQVERKIEEHFRRWLSPEAGAAEGREVIEVHREILDDATHHISLLQRGRKTFPYNRLNIQVVVPDESRRPVFQMALAEGDQLKQDILEALRQAGCEVPTDLQVATEILPEPTPDTGSLGFYIAYQRLAEAKPEPVAPAAKGTARLTVLAGEAIPPIMDLVKSRTTLGRMSDLVDDQQRLIRRNDLAFAEAAEGPNATVSRAHGFIQLDSATGEYRLHDEGSAYGTAVLRDGRLIPVPARTGRGITLRSQDEIYLGQARLRFEQ